MDLLAAWLLYPLALALLCLGLGLLAGRLAGWRFSAVLLLPAGAVTLVALARLLTEEAATAQFALPVIALLALGGLALERDRLRRLRPEPWIALATLGVFAVFAAPIVLSGEPTFAGYLALPDTAHQMTLADLVAQHGFDYSALEDGSYRRSSIGYVDSAYPVAGQAALGVTAPLGLLDLAWLYQPFLTFMAAMTALALAAIVAPLLRHRWQVAVAAFVAAQPALVVGFALQGSIKELTLVAVVTTAVALLALAIRERQSARALLLLAVAAAAALGALGPAAFVYLAAMALVVVAVWGIWIIRERRPREVLWLAAAAALAVVLALPVIATLETQIRIQGGTLDAGRAEATGAAVDLGNLAGPLKPQQVLGVWLSGDYRYEPLGYRMQQNIALGLAGACALLGMLWAVRRRAWPPLLLAGVLVVPSVVLLERGGPYADAKVLAILSPAVLLLAVLGALVLWSGRWRAVSLVLTAALAGSVLASNALAYHDVSLAPYDRYDELLSLHDRVAGDGPVVFNEYDEFGKYFLRNAQPRNEPEWPHGYREAPYAVNALVDPQRRPSPKTPLDMDDLPLRYLEEANWVILRRSPTSSRPPASFERVFTGTFYELWRRTRAPEVLRHKPLGPDFLRVGAEVTAEQARAWADRARQLGGQIAYVPRKRLVGLFVTRHPRPAGWHGYAGFPMSVVTSGPGRIRASIRLPRTARYNIWAEGSFARELRIEIDDTLVGTTDGGLNNPGAHALVATRRLTGGAHEVQIIQAGGDLTPGSGGYRSSLRHLGPIWFQPVENVDLRVVTVAPDDWRRLVGVYADWLEIVQ